jgi:hypothetical protein
MITVRLDFCRIQKKNDSGNRRQGGGGWGTPLKKRSATRIKISKNQAHPSFPLTAPPYAVSLILDIL